MGSGNMSQGLITLAGSRIYTSMADTEEVIDEVLRKFETVLAAYT
jgi:glutamate-1-semialdehyde 2,1-aminomutase